jgi:hypothetical protein
MRIGKKAYAPDGSLCPVGFENLIRRSRHSSMARQLSDTAGFLLLHDVVRMANLRAEDIRMVVRHNHMDGTPRFQIVSVPTDSGDQEFVRATSGHSFDIADDIVSILQNASRRARRAWRRPLAPSVDIGPVHAEPTESGLQEPRVGPQHPSGAQASSSSASLAPVGPSGDAAVDDVVAPLSGVFAPSDAEPEPAPDIAHAAASELPLSPDTVAAKTEGVLPVSLVDDAVP